jgi:hypothetical protein
MGIYTVDRYTIFLDIDGCIFEHLGSLDSIYNSWYNFTESEDYLLPNVTKKIGEWCDKGYRVILTTGRPESMRDLTQTQLDYFSIPHDLLIMGLTNAPRVLINDIKSDGTVSAIAISLERNKGLGDIEL